MKGALLVEVGDRMGVALRRYHGYRRERGGLTVPDDLELALAVGSPPTGGRREEHRHRDDLARDK